MPHPRRDVRVRHRLPQRVPVRRQGGVHQGHQRSEAESVREQPLPARWDLQPDHDGAGLQVPLRGHRLPRPALSNRMPLPGSRGRWKAVPLRVRRDLTSARRVEAVLALRRAELAIIVKSEQEVKTRPVLLHLFNHRRGGSGRPPSSPHPKERSSLKRERIGKYLNVGLRSCSQYYSFQGRSLSLGTTLNKDYVASFKNQFLRKSYSSYLLLTLACSSCTHSFY